MIKARINSKGRITLPREWVDRIDLTPRRVVKIEQPDDGCVILHPLRSILHLAGCLRPSQRPNNRSTRRPTREASQPRIIGHRFDGADPPVAFRVTELSPVACAD